MAQRIVKLTGTNICNYDPTVRTKVISAYAKLVTSAGVGNRQIDAQAKITGAGTETFFKVAQGAVQAASLTREYGFFGGAQSPAAFTDGTIEHPIPTDGVIIPANGRFSIFDSANIDAAGDVMTAFLIVEDSTRK